MNEKIEVPLSKKKISLLLLMSTVFVALGILFTTNPAQFVTSLYRSPEIIRIVGIASVVVFGFFMVLLARKFFDKKVGLTIDQNGITDNTSMASVGLIEWADITGLAKVQIASTKILMVQTDKPDKYIDRAGNGLTKRAMKTNYKMYGSPLSITSSSLTMNFNELEQLLRTELEKRKNKIGA